MITAGEVLKNKRELLGKSLDRVSLDTKIQRRFIEYIENNQFDYFDSEVFLTGFIKIYAQYLELDVNKILALYRRSNPNQTFQKEKKAKREVFDNSKSKRNLNFLNPKTLLTGFLILFLIMIVSYIGFQIYKFQSPPELKIVQPTNESEFTSEKILVKGETEPESTVEVNGTAVEVDKEGNFQREISLNEGSNTVTVRARKNNTLEKVEVVKVTYLKEEAEEEEKEEEIKENIITLEVFDSPSWVKLDIDNENKIARVLEPSEFEFPIKENLYVITGRISNTRLLYNGDVLNWQTNQTTGVAELTCQIEEGKLLCE